MLNFKKINKRVALLSVVSAFLAPLANVSAMKT